MRDGPCFDSLGLAFGRDCQGYDEDLGNRNVLASAAVQTQMFARVCACVCVCVCTCQRRPLSGGLGSGLLPGCAAVLMMRVQLAVVDPICAAHSFCLPCHGAVWRLLVMNNIPEG